ncbi:hypothetical protein [Amycolatopsis suaedae]|uniref:PPE domain-containing protein n=1 Tax=Amycolatopsis suaedae TaxID=2510978 RepID=A0A4Q7J8G7_9PSEU|nr:hypothetical protein [Amycolatopsis suaedae]RZQ62394.1 hypothetical protein EWH70_19190 [Amycolatopsis suaedae]
MDTGVNWEAYSHEELYEMLWQEADVADVSTIAAEWSQHRAALVNHTEVLREQRAALLDGWRGTGAEEAARRLGVLADRVEKIAELARAGEQAAERAADALARARAMMPPPPGKPVAPMGTPAANWAGLTAPPAWSPPPLPSAPQSDPGAAFGAVGGAGFSFFVGANATDMQKQQAVRAMRTYESSLTDSSRMIGQARDTIPPAATSPSSATAPASASGTAGAARSWQSLVGPGSGTATALPGTVTGGTALPTGLPPSAQLAPGVRVGAMDLPGGSVAAARAAAESAAARSGSMGGMVPPGAGARGGADDEEHENQMPRMNHGLFPLAEPASEEVIGEVR